MLKKTQKYPVKTTLNLVIKERPANYYRNLSAAFLIGVVVIGVFTRFAVIGRLSAANAAEKEASVQVEHYEQLIKGNVVFEEVRTEYEKYFTDVGTGISYADCMDVLSLIEKNIMPGASVKSIVFAGSKISVTLINTDLNQTAAIVRKLYASEKSEIIDTVSMSNADTTGDTSDHISLIEIVLVSEEGSKGK